MERAETLNSSSSTYGEIFSKLRFSLNALSMLLGIDSAVVIIRPFDYGSHSREDDIREAFHHTWISSNDNFF